MEILDAQMHSASAISKKIEHMGWQRSAEVFAYATKRRLTYLISLQSVGLQAYMEFKQSLPAT